MKDDKIKAQDEKSNSRKPHSFKPNENEQELYLEHLMRMMVNVIDRGFQKS